MGLGFYRGFGAAHARCKVRDGRHFVCAPTDSVAVGVEDSMLIRIIVGLELYNNSVNSWGRVGLRLRVVLAEQVIQA